MLYLQQTKIEQKYVRTAEASICNIGFLGRIHKNGVIKMIFIKEIEEVKSNTSGEEDGYNSKNIIVDSIRQGIALAVCDSSAKNGCIAE